ncbi:hypothetical protein [Rhodococcus triatomae]
MQSADTRVPWGPHETPRILPPRCPTRAGALRLPTRPTFDENKLPGGTNGYTTSWGTNAHGKMAGCPPSST